MVHEVWTFDARTYRAMKEALLLGVDGKVHAGQFEQKMSGYRIMQTDCKTAAMRKLGPNETWWHNTDWRICKSCFSEIG